jgi:hypothetical protein
MSENSFVEITANKNSLAQRKNIHGIGINDAPYAVTRIVDGKRQTCPFYAKWDGMLRRCYCTRYHEKRPTYIDCEVEKEWLLFSNFKKWMIRQDWKGKDLDKDIKIQGNKIYSKDTCLFVSRAVNSLLGNNKAKRGQFPIGVSFFKRDNNFVAHCKRDGRSINIGYFSTPERAHKAWRKFKREVILEAANKPENSYIRRYLINHANMLL